MYKKINLTKIVIINISYIFSLLSAFQSIAQNLFINNDIHIQAINGSGIYVFGSIQNSENGTISITDIGSVQSEIYISHDFINNGIAGGSGNYHIYGNWINNNIFNALNGTVFLKGDNQLLSGSTETNFNNLVLSGTGQKTQTINQFVKGFLNLNDIELHTNIYGMFVENTNINSIQRTNGFVSSLHNGFLSRITNSNNIYLFPVGSSEGINRYRPVEITPNDSNDNTYTVRMANVDASSEGFDRNLVAQDICQTNPLFYHRINRIAGTTPVQMNIYFDENTDGSWQGIANWITNPNQWEIVIGSTSTSSSPLSYAQANNWSAFTQTPYILYNVNPIVQIDVADPFCNNDASVSLNATPAGGTWSGIGITDTNAGTFDPSVAGTGNHVITYNVGIGECTTTAQISIVVEETPVVNILGSLESCSGALDGSLSTSVFGGTAPFNYLWNTGDTTPNISGVGNGSYLVIITDSNDCQSFNDFFLQDPNIPCYISQNHIYIPNIFSPNNDGENDILFVRGININLIEFVIFNRWGEKIFESFSINNGWDGRYNGDVCDQGAYVYFVKGNYFDGESFQQKGYITLIR
jgi:gliding motility-associated-like protein